MIFAITAGGMASAIFQALTSYAALRAEIVGANIETIRGMSAGSLTLLVKGDPSALHAALSTFERAAIPFEVIGA